MGWRRWGDFVLLNKVNKIDFNEMIFLRKKSGSEFWRYLGEKLTKARKASAKAQGQDHTGH